MIENKKIFVLGLAKSGFNITKLLYTKNEIVVCDQKEPSIDVSNELKKMNVTFYLEDEGINIFDNSFDLLIKNPGIMPSHPLVKKAQDLNIKIVNEMEVAYHYLPKDTFIIGITGSNGKTTTTTMIYDLLKLHNVNAVLGGNIGYPLSELIPIIKENTTLVLEISDHQLYNLIDFKTNISILTNLCPTHLDFHGNYENYKNVKKKIFKHHTKDDLAIINYQNEDSMLLTKDIKSTKIYSNNDINYYNDIGIYINKELIIKKEDIKIKGNHNYENILASLITIKEVLKDKLNKDIIINYFKHFNGVEHRIEVVDSKSNIAFYNDSKATNPTSTLIALKTMERKTRLILGGMERKQDFHELDKEMNKVTKIYAIGEVTDRIDDYAREVNISCSKCYTLQNAMEEIKKDALDNEAVLLSPASASWDQYDKFETRGEEFKNIVEKLFN